MIRLRISSCEHPGDLRSICSSLSMSFLYCETPNWRQQHCRGGIIRAEERGNDEVLSAFWPCSILHAHAPFHSALGAVGQCCQNWLLAEVRPSGTARPSSPSHSAVAGIRSIQGAGLGLCAYWMSYEVPAEPALPTALPSSVCIPALRFRLPEEGAWYQNLTQKAKFWKLLQLVSGTMVRRLTNADDISSFLSLPEKTSCKCKHAHTFEPSMYRYASTDVDSNVLYDKIFNWGGERESKFKILLLL